MDTSKEYAEMSHSAFPSPDTMPLAPLNKTEEHVYVDSGGSWWIDYKGWFIPLYRQDQLQEMVGMQRPCIKHFIAIERFQFGRPYKGVYRSARPDLPSFEQLWLAFVMHEKYKKAWDTAKKEWVKA